MGETSRHLHFFHPRRPRGLVSVLHLKLFYAIPDGSPTPGGSRGRGELGVPQSPLSTAQYPWIPTPPHRMLGRKAEVSR